MSATEAEAKQRWCPFARAPLVHGEGSVNRFEERSGSEYTMIPHRLCYCLASKCMAWRWDDVRRFETAVTNGTRAGTNYEGKYLTGRPAEPPPGEGWEPDPAYADAHRLEPTRVHWRRPWTDARTGLCGLAEPRVAYIEQG